MLEEVEYCKEIMKNTRKKLIMIKENKRHHRKANKFRTCKKLKRYTGKDIRVKGHCHIAGE